jgi:hypothetical protein
MVEGLYQIRVKYPFFGGDKAEGSTSTGSVTRQKEKKTSAEKGVIKADLVLGGLIVDIA